MSSKNKLTFFIFLALVMGVAVGYYLNVSSFSENNNAIYSADTQIKKVEAQMSNLPDTTVAQYAVLKTQKADFVKLKKDNETIREKKLEPFTLLSDIFLRLIKMIVAPLVFTTLVVGVAKVGDIKAVGRIGGKTMLWFISASFMSLLLGMLLVNFWKPGEAMNLPLPSSHTDTGIKVLLCP